MPNSKGISVLLIACLIAPVVHAKISQWTPIDTSEGWIKVASAINGIEGYSIIDSGANLHAINEAFLREAKLELHKIGRGSRVQGVVGEEVVGNYAPINVRVFGEELEFRSLRGLDLGDPNLQLLIGAGFLRHFIFQFDYPQNRMRLMSRDAVNMKKVANVPSKSARGAGTPLVKVRLNDELDVWLVLDTGSTGGVLLDRNVVDRTSWLEEYEQSAGTIQGVVESGQTHSFVLPSVKFGPFDLGGVAIRTQAEGKEFKMFEQSTYTGTHIPRSSTEAVGLLGYQVLKHFVITLDYRSGRVHVGTRASP